MVPYEGEFTVYDMKQWLTKFVKGEVKHKEMNFGQVIDADIKYMLPKTIPLSRKDFMKTIYGTEGEDLVVLLYTTHFENEA